MTDEWLFGLANAVPLIGWLALALAPLARARLVAVARVVAALLAVAYTGSVLAALIRGGGAAPDLLTLDGLAHAFSDPRVMLIGWVHYLALDLWTGAWEAEEAGRAGVPHWAALPCIALTFLAGPAGLALFLLARAALRRRLSAVPTAGQAPVSSTAP